MRFQIQSKREWVSHQSDCGIHLRTQQNGIKKGVALMNHMDNAHGGKFDPNCNACREIKKKMESL